MERVNCVTAYWGENPNLSEIIDALNYCFFFDNDFNGENGMEYVCPMAEMKLCASNMDYISRIIIEGYGFYPDDFKVIEIATKYIDFFFDVGGSYYVDKDDCLVYNNNNRVVGIAIAYVTN